MVEYYYLQKHKPALLEIHKYKQDFSKIISDAGEVARRQRRHILKESYVERNKVMSSSESDSSIVSADERETFPYYKVTIHIPKQHKPVHHKDMNRNKNDSRKSRFYFYSWIVKRFLFDRIFTHIIGIDMDGIGFLLRRDYPGFIFVFGNVVFIVL